MDLKQKIPWWMKIIIKLILSRVPLDYSMWRNIIFKHGSMLDPSYAYNIFLKHFKKLEISTNKSNLVVLELGPGDSIYSAMISYSFGASHTYLIDTDNYASENMNHYLQMVEYLEKKGKFFPSIKHINSVKGILKTCKAEYFTEGVASLRTIPENSIDLIWSEAVFEHIQLSDFDAMLVELKRILKPNGLISNRIDLRDHLAHSLNNLRFSSRMWESSFMKKSGFYTNRIRYSQMLNIFKNKGFNVESNVIETWDKLPIPRSKLSSDFIHLSDKDLCVKVYDVLLHSRDS